LPGFSTSPRTGALDRLRARGPLAYAEPVEDLEIADEAKGAEALLAEAGDAARLHDCLGELDDRTQGVIRTAFFEGVTYEALARRMDAPLGTVKSWIRRGLARLKGCLER
jgi:RNA polymerase sigma-70 factor (ECF subfamily)